MLAKKCGMAGLLLLPYKVYHVADTVLLPAAEPPVPRDFPYMGIVVASSCALTCRRQKQHDPTEYGKVLDC